jgi:hypothetical protein
MDAQGVINVIFSSLMVLILICGGIFLFARACDEEWEIVIGAAIGAVMTVSLYGIYVISNLPK